jgi:hypothetical protein
MTDNELNQGQPVNNQGNGNAATPPKSPIKKFIGYLFGFLCGLAIVVTTFIFAEDIDSFIFVFIGIIFGGLVAFSMCVLMHVTRKEIKETIAQEKAANGKSKLKRKIIATFVVSFFIIAAAGLIAATGYGIYDVYYLNESAKELAEEVIDENIFDEIDEFEERYNNKNAWSLLFFTEEDTVEAVKVKADEFVLKCAAEKEQAIKALKPCTEITSTEDHNNYVEAINAITLSESNSFEKRVLEKVSNYSDFEKYVNDFEALKETYKVETLCGSCSGAGRFSCGSCNGSGKFVVTWYEYGDWGDTSYTSSSCGACNGAGRRTCGACNGSGKNIYYDFD